MEAAEVGNRKKMIEGSLERRKRFIQRECMDGMNIYFLIDKKKVVSINMFLNSVTKKITKDILLYIILLYIIIY